MAPLRLIFPRCVAVVAGVLFCTALAAFAAGAESKSEPQRFATVEHDGVVILDIPSDWKPITKQRGRWPSRTIIITDAGKLVVSRITPSVFERTPLSC